MPFILGLSGGIDSAVCAALLKLADVPMCLYFIDVESSEQSAKDAKIIADSLSTPLQTICLDQSFNQLLGDMKLTVSADRLNLVKGNIKARLRMIQQYTMANLHRGLVVGTENKSENIVGYATKHGDAACDVTFINDLTKTEVVYMAELLGIPQCIIDKKPSADLWPDQTDEGELGFTYQELDTFLLHLDPLPCKDVIENIMTLYKNSRHKFSSSDLCSMVFDIRHNDGNTDCEKQCKEAK
jgi:NAD+ synthase